MQLDDIEFTININDIDPHEGFFGVSLYYQNQRVYTASFTLLELNKLLIVSIQGTNAENAPELIRTVTKKLHGIHPMFMLINLFKMLCDHYGLVQLGIPHKYQAKYRFNDSHRLLFDYDEFWQKNGAHLVGDY